MYLNAACYKGEKKKCLVEVLTIGIRVLNSYCPVTSTLLWTQNAIKPNFDLSSFY